jgi:DNA-directed RNA polymerase specialized sigma24 family protein
MQAMPEVSVPFEDFVRARSAALFRFALLLTAHQDRSEAEDLLQEALERAYRHWPRICRSGDPERYVRRVLANASTDRWRRLRRRPERPLPDGDPGPPADVWPVTGGMRPVSHSVSTGPVPPRLNSNAVGLPRYYVLPRFGRG